MGNHLAGCPTCPLLDAVLAGVRASEDTLRDPHTVVEKDLADRIREGFFAG